MKNSFIFLFAACLIVTAINAQQPLSNDIQTNNINSTIYYPGADVTTTKAGQYAFTWPSTVNSLVQVQKREYTNVGVPIFPQATITSGPLNSTYGSVRCKISMKNNSSGYIIVYEEINVNDVMDPNYSSIYYQEFNSFGIPVSAPVFVDSGVNPDIDIAPDGTFNITYFSGHYYYQPQECYVKCYNAFGFQVGFRITVATYAYPDGLSGYPNIFSLNNNAFSITHIENGGQGIPYLSRYIFGVSQNWPYPNISVKLSPNNNFVVKPNGDIIVAGMNGITPSLTRYDISAQSTSYENYQSGSIIQSEYMYIGINEAGEYVVLFPKVSNHNVYLGLYAQQYCVDDTKVGPEYLISSSIIDSYTVSVDVSDCEYVVSWKKSETESYHKRFALYPSVTAGEDASIICGNSIQLGGGCTGVSGETYLWSPATGLNNSTISNPTANPTITTTYTISVSSANCTRTDQVVITVTDLIADAGNNTTICSGSSATLTATGGDNYLWSNGGNTQSIIVSPTVNTTYTVTVSTNNGCTATDNVWVRVNPNPSANASINQNICLGTTTTISSSPFGGLEPYTYLWSSTETSSSINVTPSQSTTYTVTVTDANGCSATDDVVVTILPKCECPAQIITNLNNLNSGTMYELQSDVTVTGNLSLTDVTIRIRNASPIKITIASGASLTLNHCHLFGCDNMWQGIVINGTGILIINNGSLIEDAIIAVDIDNATLTSFSADGSVFNKNSTGIRIKDYTQTSGSYPFEINNTVFTSRDYTYVTSLISWPIPDHSFSLFNLSEMISQGALNEHYRASNFNSALTLDGLPAITGIELENVGSLSSGSYFEAEINGDDPNITGTTVNIFDNLYYGINATNSNFTCQNNAFQYIIGTAAWTDGMAIKAHNTNTPFTSENRIKVVGSGTGTKNNYFYDCKIGIDVYNYDVIEISDVNMRSDHGTLEGLIGIQIETVQSSDLEIGNNTLTNILYGILFTGLNATYSGTPESQNIHGPFNIHNNLIQANLTGSPVTTENVTLGILLRNLLIASPVQSDCNTLNITENMLYNVRNGIKAEKWWFIYYEKTGEDVVCMGNRPVIESNYITLVDPNAATQFGINSILNWNGIIENNNIQGFSNSDVGYYGIRCENNLSVPFGNPDNGQIVQCNEVNNVGKGIEFVDDQIDTKFFNNTMEACFWGFVLNNNAVIGQQGDETADLGSNNSWPVSSYDNYTLPGQCKTYVIGSNAQNSRLVVDQTNNDQNPESQGVAYNSGNPFVVTDVYWIAPGNLIPIANNTNSIVCNTASNSLKSNTQSGNLAANTSNFINWLEKLVQDSVENKVYPAEQYINNKFRVYRMLEVQPLLMENSTILKNFYIAAKNGPIGNITNIENALALGQNALAQSQLNNISANNDIEANYLDFYSLYNKYADSTFSASDSILLKAIADGCPARDGIAVYNARSLYGKMYYIFNFIDGCNNSSTSKTQTNTNVKKHETVEQLVVYPNPTTGDVWLLPGTEILGKQAVVSVDDILGNQVHYETLSISNNTKISAKLRSGTYILTLTINDNYETNVFKTKIIVIN